MESNEAIEALAALAQPTRLAAFRALISAEPDGLGAGELARLLGVPANTLTNHMAILTRAGLATTSRAGRAVTCRAAPLRVDALADFLTRDCCGGQPALCVPPGQSCGDKS